MISQELFDETILENEEVFELAPEEALKETIEQLTKASSGQSLQHLSLTHPESAEGKIAREERRVVRDAMEALTAGDDVVTDQVVVVEALELMSQTSDQLLLGLVQPERILKVLSSVASEWADGNEKILALLLPILIRLLTKNQAQRDAMRTCLTLPLLQLEYWKGMMQQEDTAILNQVLDLVQISCKKNEENKKAWTAPRNSLQRLVYVLDASPGKPDVALAVCRLTTTLCRFDDFGTSQSITIASTNDTVLELSRCGMVAALEPWLARSDDHTDKLEAALWTTLRVLCVHETIIKSIVSRGLLEKARLVKFTSVELATALMGLFRNLAAQDDLKTALCEDPVLMKAVLHDAPNSYPEHVLLQEHMCGLVAAMALREPENAARLIQQYDAPRVVLQSMKRHSHNVPLQRQGALAIRNLASRVSPELKQVILSSTPQTESILKNAGKYCVDEAFGALRDLGIEVGKTTIHADGTVSTRPKMFGEVQSNFRAIYD